MTDIVLEMTDITKEFPGVKALDQVNLQVTRGEIHAICGENGAGKTTLMNVLTGTYPYGSYSGEIRYNGELCQFNKIEDSEACGIVIIHQELALIPHMDIAENIFLGNEQGSKYNIDWRKTHLRAVDQMRLVDLHESPYTLVKNLGVGKQQLVEIAKALSKNVKLLVLDEPTASLNEKDARRLLDLLLALKKEGLTSIIISHKLNEIAYVADSITVIRDGKTIETLSNKEHNIDENRIIRGMVGRELSDRYPKRKSTVGDVGFEIRDWTVFHPRRVNKKVVDGVNLTIRKGEIVGIAGLIGAGRTELAMSVFGRSYGRNISGQMFIDGKAVELKTISEAIEAGLAYVTEDRKDNGLILDSTINTNHSLANLKRVSKRGVIDRQAERKAAKEMVDRLHVKCRFIDQKVGNLSGGNQQKILLGKWIFTDPDILILDEPTRGIDVGAKYEIYEIANALVAEGKCVLMISSDMSELLGMCDRIYVMDAGRIKGEFPIEEASQEKIMSCIVKDVRKEEA
ncbi:MAG: sugar ABC transporter ATP-binding protein [Peptoniphilaceae bacterium]|nr:sugar ABC transporter ATP-binding protein [Peptoniphilaceae bacterium]